MARLNITDLSIDSELAPDEESHLRSAFSTRRETDPLNLERGKFNRLQAGMERGIARMMAESQSQGDRPIVYRVPIIPTPLHNIAHDRVASIREVLLPPKSILRPEPLGVCVVSEPSLRTAVEEGVFDGNLSKRLQELLRQIAPGTFSLSSTEAERDYMAVHVPYNLPDLYLAFTARQSASRRDLSDGQVLFGPEAEAMYQTAIAEHKANLAAGRDMEKILKVLKP